FACSRKNHDLVLWIGADGLEQLADGAVVLDAQLYGPPCRVSLDQDHAVGATFQFVELFESLLIFGEARSGDKLCQRHVRFSSIQLVRLHPSFRRGSTMSCGTPLTPAHKFRGSSP